MEFSKFLSWTLPISSFFFLCLYAYAFLNFIEQSLLISLKLRSTLDFFWLLFGCPTVNFGPLLREQPDSLDINHFVFTFLTRRGHRESHSKAGSLSPAQCLVGFEPGSFRFWLQRVNPLGYSPLKHCSHSCHLKSGTI